MAQFSLTISRWRMLRIALRKKKTRFEELRSMARRDQSDVEWLVAKGFFVEVGEGQYEVTDIGRASADMGFYEWEPPRRVAPEAAAASGAKVSAKRGKK